MSILVSIYNRLQKWKEAEVLGVVVMEKQKTVLGQYHHDTLQTMATLITTFQNLGKGAVPSHSI